MSTIKSICPVRSQPVKRSDARLTDVHQDINSALRAEAKLIYQHTVTEKQGRLGWVPVDHLFQQACKLEHNMNYYIPVQEWLMSNDYHGNDLPWV